MSDRRRKLPKRSGAALVEMAFVLLIFVMLLFGILEFCRFLYVRQVMQNAVREGARYAVVHTYDANVVADTQARVKTYMCGLDAKSTGYKCSVYRADANGNQISGAVVDAPFGAYIGVEATLDFVPVTPALLFLPKTMTLKSKCCMGSEAN